MAIDHIITEQGSVYKYLPDGRTQRHNKVKDKLYEPQDVLVFVPSFERAIAAAPEDVKPKLGANEQEYSKMISTYIMAKGKKAFVIDENGNKITSNEEAKQAERVLLALCNGTATDITIPVLTKPRLGFFTFDTRKYENGTRRESHLGNRVVEIVDKK